jgi:hypothetical protein
VTVSIEAIRASYRPTRILTLFVGESAPKSGKFFYCGNTALATYMRNAMDAAGLGGDGDFRDRFKARGWYLDDLVLFPINDRKGSPRMKECRDAIGSLVARIKEYQPRAIVSLLLSIQDFVEAAAANAGSKAPRFVVPFAGNSHQERFREEMARIILQLPKNAL